DVVEVVRDAARQTPHRLELEDLPQLVLAPPQRFLRLLALRDVTPDAHGADPVPRGIAHRRLDGLEPADGAVVGVERLLRHERLARLQDTRIFLVVPRRLLLGPEVPVRAARDLTARPAARPREGVDDGVGAADLRLLPGPIRDVSKQRLPLPLLLPTR